MRNISELSEDERKECEMLMRAWMMTFEDIKEETIEKDLSEDEVWEERWKTRQWVKNQIIDILKGK